MVGLLSVNQAKVRFHTVQLAIRCSILSVLLIQPVLARP
jgi:hypothetical protein